ncbi:MAG TPA: TIM44-like domain-containing protein [Microvirga sp.]|jgi:predicted lipid-binding transport protein (Tim44 family)|nr:TIM44-like domain-containing protein [Microvirga sp.]
MMNLRSRRSRTGMVLAAALVLAAGVAEARVGRGGSFGSRGGRTYDAPPVTRTAPAPASPIQRSQVPNTGPAIQRPGVPPASVAQPRRFGTGFMAGLFGAGLLGMLFGAGFFGGLAGLGSILGFLIQLALVALLVSFALRWFRRRQQEPAFAGPQGHARAGLGASVPPAAAATGGGLGAGLGGALGGLTRQAAPQRRRGGDEVGLNPADFNAFERTLQDVQAAYSRQDVAALWGLATPEMAGYIQEELNENARNGVINTLRDVRLLQGDLAEAWREGAADYATVAMRFSAVDVTVDRASGRVVDGDPTRASEVTELWTFRRDRGGSWKLSAIQQA